MGKKPIFGICLGHQILGFAFGGTTFKLKFGHHGGEPAGKRFAHAEKWRSHRKITVLPSIRSRCRQNVEVTHINLNDGTVEGMRHKELPIFSVQYHPEAAPGPHDAGYFFRSVR